MDPMPDHVSLDSNLVKDYILSRADRLKIKDENIFLNATDAGK